MHLELRTANVARACAFYTQLFGWRSETVHAGSATYLALDFATSIEGGVVERDGEPATWLPYVEVDDLGRVTERAHRLGATVALGAREGPAGWRSTLAVPAGAEVALWQPKV